MNRLQILDYTKQMHATNTRKSKNVHSIIFHNSNLEVIHISINGERINKFMYHKMEYHIAIKFLKLQIQLERG